MNFFFQIFSSIFFNFLFFKINILFSSVRVQDDFLIFRRWRSYVPKDLLEDLSHSDTRVSIQLNGFELHIYNRTSTYKGELSSDLVLYYQNCFELL